MSPGHKRQIVEELVAGGRCTARAACRHFGLHRSTFAYQAKEPDAWLARLKSALRRMSNRHPEMGYPKITKLLKDEGWKFGTRMVQRLRRELGLAVFQPRSRRSAVRSSLQACRRKQHTGGTSGLGTSFTTQQSVGANSECSILLMSILANACASMWIVESMLEKCVACSRS